MLVMKASVKMSSCCVIFVGHYVVRISVPCNGRFEFDAECEAKEIKYSPGLTHLYFRLFKLFLSYPYPACDYNSFIISNIEVGLKLSIS